LTDHLGSVTRVENDSGRVVEAISLDPYGNLESERGSEQVALTFTGKPRDAVSGIISIGVRSFDPMLGMWASRDKKKQFWTPYGYGNPLATIDPDGNNDENIVVQPNESKVDLTKPGPFAGESVKADGPSRQFTASQRAQVNKIGKETGCHLCGTKDPGTKTGNFVPDHIPPNKVAAPGEAQNLYPSCKACSNAQGGMLRWMPKTLQTLSIVPFVFDLIDATVRGQEYGVSPWQIMNYELQTGQEYPKPVLIESKVDIQILGPSSIVHLLHSIELENDRQCDERIADSEEKS
jgi:RHS repeat-associated protein